MAHRRQESKMLSCFLLYIPRHTNQIIQTHFYYPHIFHKYPQKQDIQHKTLLPISKYNIIILRYKTDILTFSKLHTIKKNIYFLGCLKKKTYICKKRIPMEAQKKLKLKDIANIFSGIYERTDPNGDIIYLQTKDCSDSIVTKYASRVFLTPKAQKNLLQNNDILFACKGTNYLCLTYNQEEDAVASTSFFVIRVKSDKVLPEYLCWFLRQPATKNYFKTFQTGSATPLIRKQNVDELEINIPELHTQTLIVKIDELSQREKHLQETIIKRKELIIKQLLMNKTI